MQWAALKWRPTLDGRSVWHLSTTAPGSLSASRSRVHVVARSLCRFRYVSLQGLPAAERLNALQVELQAWCPFDEPRYALVQDAKGYAVWAWDAQQLSARLVAPTGSVAPALIWPESLLQPPPGTAGAAALRLLACREGCEGQFWQGPRLLASRWWPAWPDAAAWANFQRSAGVPAALRQVQTPTPQTWPGQPRLQRPWAMPTTPHAQRDRQRVRWHATVAATTLLLAAPTLWLGVGWWRTADEVAALNSRMRTLETELEPVLKLRADALQGMTALDTLGAAWGHTDVLPLLAHLSERVAAAGGGVVKDLEWADGRLKMSLDVPASTPRVAYVRALEEGGLLRGVREDSQEGTRGGLVLSAEVQTAEVQAAEVQPAGATEAKP